MPYKKEVIEETQNYQYQLGVTASKRIGIIS